MKKYELDTFLTITDGVGYSDKREFYQTAYGWGFNQYFWIELEIVPVPPTSTTLSGGLGGVPYKPIEQIHVVRIFIKTPSGQIITKQWTVKEKIYNIILKFINKKVTVPKIILKLLGTVTDLYQKTKIKLSFVGTHPQK